MIKVLGIAFCVLIGLYAVLSLLSFITRLVIARREKHSEQAVVHSDCVEVDGTDNGTIE